MSGPYQCMLILNPKMSHQTWKKKNPSKMDVIVVLNWSIKPHLFKVLIEVYCSDMLTIHGTLSESTYIFENGMAPVKPPKSCGLWGMLCQSMLHLLHILFTYLLAEFCYRAEKGLQMNVNPLLMALPRNWDVEINFSNSNCYLYNVCVYSLAVCFFSQNFHESFIALF